MAVKEYKARVIVTACAIAFGAASGAAMAQTSSSGAGVTTGNPPVTFGDAADAVRQVTESAQIVRQMERDEGMAQLLRQAQGVFIVPDYGRAAWGVGVRGGEGVLLAKRNGQWSDPAFYNMGGVSFGVQAGAQGGAIAFVLMNQRALNSFKQENNWSLNADAGLTIVAWSAKGQASAGKGDVVAWSGTEGLFGGLAISVTDINFDEDETAAYYGRQVALNDILTGTVTNPHSSALQQALGGAATPAQTSGGTTATGTAAAGAEPITLIVPLAVRDTAIRNGCWVQLVSNPGAGMTSGTGSQAGAGASGASSTGSSKVSARAGAGEPVELTLAGELNMPRLATSTGVDWAQKTDRIIVGPNATATIFSGEQFQGKSQTLKSDQRIDNLRQQVGFAQSINSMRINCRS